MINSKQRAQLKKISHSYKPIVNIGKGGVSENTIRQIDEALTSRELIKIKVLNNNLDDRDFIIDSILEGTGADFVKYMGSILTIYRPSENKVIDLED
ncbi:MAG: ribosome assembly RNA-binding protein YhbY [Finegoldia sp.]|nr:ribosome assembly RNA-binding protein YhbY [Finegoldia sp.]